ncbi:MAG: hypothetical protein QXF09_05860 [Nitrososphaerota archaeon]
MSPLDIAWVVPIIIPFFMGLIVGLILRRTINLMLMFTVLAILLIISGTISITLPEIFDYAAKVLPKIIELGKSSLNILPYSSISFIIGLILGLQGIRLRR